MFDYVRELGYSTGAAWRRLKAMRLCEEVNGARGRLLEGTLTLDAAAQLQHAFERQERKARRSTTPGTDTHRGGGHEAQADAGSATPVVEPAARAAVAPGGPAPDGAARAAGPEGSEGAEGTPRLATGCAGAAGSAGAGRGRAGVAGGGGGRQEHAAGKGDARQSRSRSGAGGGPDGRGAVGAQGGSMRRQVGLVQLKGLLSHVDPQMTLQLLGRVVREALDATTRRGRRAVGAAAAGLPLLPDACRQAPRLRRRKCRQSRHGSPGPQKSPRLRRRVCGGAGDRAAGRRLRPRFLPPESWPKAEDRHRARLAAARR